MLQLLALVTLLSGSPPERPASSEVEAVRLARETVAREASVSPDAVTLHRAQPVVWTDESLGCARPSAQRVKSAIPGYRVVVGAAARLYTVHVGDGRAVVCGAWQVGTPPKQDAEAPAEDLPIPEPTDAGLRALVDQAKEGLAGRLRVAKSEIRLVKVKQVVWPDGSLGCPQAGMVYPQVLQDGVLIQLRHGTRRYEYHAGGSRDPFLCEKPAPPSPDKTGS